MTDQYVKELIRHLKRRKSVLFSDENTWRTSGPEYETSARHQEEGYNDAIKEIESFVAKNPVGA